MSLALLEGDSLEVASLRGSSLDSLGGLELGSVLVFSTSPPGDVYWLTQAPSEPPIKMIRIKERNLI